MAKNKTTETTSSVADFLNSVADESKKNDSFRLVEIFESQTGLKAKMWGPAIVGFGSYHYKYNSGHEGDSLLAGFSPRANAISLYLALNTEERETLLKQFGKHKASKGCVYIKKLDDISTDILKEMITASVKNNESYADQ